MRETAALPTDIVFDECSLVPVVVQEHASGDVLMLAWANAEALRLTAETGWAHFWSRSRQRLWKKGESSGNALRVREVLADCDRDTLLMLVEPQGPTCHTGARSCFGEASLTAAGLLEELRRVIASRRAAPPAESYAARLFEKGLDHALEKLREETAEVVLAAKGESDRRLAEESADLLYHLLVVLEQRGVALTEVIGVLQERRKR